MPSRGSHPGSGEGGYASCPAYRKRRQLAYQQRRQGGAEQPPLQRGLRATDLKPAAVPKSDPKSECNKQILQIAVAADEYTHMESLTNCVTAAKNVSRMFCTPGVSSATYHAGSANDVIDRFSKFSQQIEMQGGVARAVVVFLAMHAVQKDGETYFMPKDANPKDASTWVPLSHLHRLVKQGVEMARRRRRDSNYLVGRCLILFVLDCCRTLIPRPCSRGPPTEITQHEGLSDTVYMHSTFTGYGANDASAYTTAFVKYLAVANLTLCQICSKIEEEMEGEAQHPQVWHSAVRSLETILFPSRDKPEIIDLTDDTDDEICEDDGMGVSLTEVADAFLDMRVHHSPTSRQGCQVNPVAKAAEEAAMAKAAAAAAATAKAPKDEAARLKAAEQEAAAAAKKAAEQEPPAVAEASEEEAAAKAAAAVAIPKGL